MKQLTEPELETLRTKYVGKRIRFTTTNKGKWAGICENISYNQFYPSFGLVVLMNRTPITHVVVKSIKFMEELFTI